MPLVGKEDKSGFTVMFGNTANPNRDNGLLPMLIITKGKTASSISKFLTSPDVERAFGDAHGCSNTGSKQDGWTDAPTHHVHEDGNIISVGAHTHWMNLPNLKLWIDKIVYPAHEAACSQGNPEAPDVPLSTPRPPLALFTLTPILCKLTSSSSRG